MTEAIDVGLRVVRGPDWKWQNQDDGEGHVGTLVEIGKPGSTTSPDKTVVIQWDSGTRTNYRIGYQGSFDLRILDNASIGVKHPNIICDSCSNQGILGMRWKCQKCYDFDLCHDCYMSDKHDLAHPFLRLENSTVNPVPVAPRNATKKLQARGIFAGAKVIRGPDWDWGNQDGGELRPPGKVLDLRGWDGESGRSVANVLWSTNASNVYRLGHKGKVDLKYTQDAPGGHYYEDHLPVLGCSHDVTPTSHSPSVFKVGDKVRVDLADEILKAMQEGHGGWNPRMSEVSCDVINNCYVSLMQFIGVVGSVHRITERGDVRVQYEGCSNRWTFHPGALTKVFAFKVNDLVKVSANEQQVRDLQKGHGEWTENMKSALGKVGKVMKIYLDGDLRVEIRNVIWTINPACVALVQNKHDVNNTMTTEREREQSNGLSAILEQLLQMQLPCAEPDRLVRETAQGNLEHVREIVSNYPDKVDVKSSGKTALQVACHQGHVEIVRLLLHAGSDLNVKDDDGDSALHYSAFGNQAEVAELLLSRGAKIDDVNKGGCSTLHVAVNKQHVAVVRILISCGANPNVQDSYGDTALHDAIGKDSREIMELLLAPLTLDLTLKNKRGFNPLHHAALKGSNFAIMRILEHSRQIVDIKKDDGFSALHLAALNGHRQVVLHLVTTGKAEIDILNNRRQSPLTLAVTQCHYSVIELLVKKGASVTLEDDDGETCLHKALSVKQPPPLTSDQAFSDLLPQLTKMTGAETAGNPLCLVSAFLVIHGSSLLHKDQQSRTPLDLVQNDRIVLVLRKLAASKNDSSNVAPANEPADCMVCCDVMSDIIFEPCGHVIVCSDCCVKMKKCLVCSKVIQQKRSLNGSMTSPTGPDSLIRQRSGEDPDQTVEELQKKVQNLEDKHNCGICLEEVKGVVFTCGHGACAKCAQPLKICHMCRKPIKQKINVF